MDLHESCALSDNIHDYPAMSMGKVKVDSIDDEEEMMIMDEAFDILGFTAQEKTNVYKVNHEFTLIKRRRNPFSILLQVSSMCMHLSKMEFVGHGEITTAKNLDAGTTLMELFGYCEAPDELYDR